MSTKYIECTKCTLISILFFDSSLPALACVQQHSSSPSSSSSSPQHQKYKITCACAWCVDTITSIFYIHIYICMYINFVCLCIILEFDTSEQNWGAWNEMLPPPPPLCLLSAGSLFELNSYICHNISYIYKSLYVFIQMYTKYKFIQHFRTLAHASIFYIYLILWCTHRNRRRFVIKNFDKSMRCI